MEQKSLNQPTPSAGSSTSASASAVPFFPHGKLRATFVGNNVARVGNHRCVRGHPNKKGQKFPSSPHATSIDMHLHRAVASFADRFNIFAYALNGVAGCGQQRCRKQNYRCNFAHHILQKF
jgi:hypothetical protein